MNSDDYYAKLNLGEDASGDEIKAAFRKLALKYHPDRNRGDADSEGRFKDIAAAYDVLGDPSRRRAYDLSRSGGFSFNRDYFRSAGAASCGRGRGCCGRGGKFRNRASFDSPWMVELSPEEARLGVEREFIMKSPLGFSTISVDIPPGGKDGTVYRVGGGVDDVPDIAFDIQIKIV